MSVEQPTRFLTVNFRRPVDIGLLPQHPGGADGELLTVRWTAKRGTTFLPYDPADEQVQGG